MTQQFLEEIVAPDISHIVIEDDTPVDNFQSAKQQRLLVEPLYASWSPGVPFIADSNIGLFYALKQDPLVPDAFVSLNLQMPIAWSQKQNRSYFVWEFGKAPEVCIEIVSNRKGNELDSKKDDYARIGVAYYVVFDPLQQLSAGRRTEWQAAESLGANGRAVCGNAGALLVANGRTGFNRMCG